MSDVKTSGVKFNFGLAIPLIGVLLFVANCWFSVWAEAKFLQEHSEFLIHPAVYLNLGGMAILVISALIGRQLTAKKLAINPNLTINRNTYVLTTVTTITALIAAVIYAFAVFIAFGLTFGLSTQSGNRLLDIYVPILLDAALIIGGILRAFVIKPKVVKND